MTMMRRISGAQSTAKLPAVPALLAVLLIPAVLGSSQTIFNDGDVSWHIATGEWILAHRSIPHVDPFSFTWGGKPWVPIEWLSELVYGSAFRLAGYGGVASLVTAALVALHAIIFLNASRWTRLALVPVVAMDFALIPMLSARPHVLTWPLLAFWTWLMLDARERNRAPPLIAALLMTLWANLHGSFVFGFMIAAVLGLEAVLKSSNKGRVFAAWLLFGLACIVAVFINGNGVQGVFHPLRFTQLKMLPLIDEWKPSSLQKTPFFFGAVAITLAIIAWKRPRLATMRWLLLAVLFALAMLQVRHQAMFAIVAALVLPRGFASGPGPEVQTDRSLTWVICGAAVFIICLRAVMPLQPAENEANPWKLIAAVPPTLRVQPVFNGYSMGGPLILSGIRPFIDGRGDMYGDELVLRYADMIHGNDKAFDEAVKRWDIRWAILPNSSKLVPLLDHRGNWHLLRRDSAGAIYVRTS